jgi:hypothetical protein
VGFTRVPDAIERRPHGILESLGQCVEPSDSPKSRVAA